MTTSIQSPNSKQPKQFELLSEARAHILKHSHDVRCYPCGGDEVFRQTFQNAWATIEQEKRRHMLAYLTRKEEEQKQEKYVPRNGMRCVS